ncbi:MAG TPA: fibronectin type III-like domain-contianing protein [Flavisolibacter sp.]|nr:fibronectin type III-like domain-contianing protein [Flavisolibacter sp.]
MVRSLKGFQRLNLKTGEAKIVRFTLTPEDLSVIDENGLAKQFTGRVLISAGGSQPDAATIKSEKTVQGCVRM